MSASDLAGAASPTVGEILAKLGSDPKTGLNSVQLEERLSKYGPNALPEEKKSALSGLLAYFWGPIPWMIEAAALMALIVGDWGILRHYLASVVQRLVRVLGGTRSFQRARRFEGLSGFKGASASRWKMGASRCADARARRYCSLVPRRRSPGGL